MKTKKKSGKRSKASFKSEQVHSHKMSAYKYDSKPSVIMSDTAKPEGRADLELKRMVRSDVFRSNPKTIKQTNSNPRRYR